MFKKGDYVTFTKEFASRITNKELLESIKKHPLPYYEVTLADLEQCMVLIDGMQWHFKNDWMELREPTPKFRVGDVVKLKPGCVVPIDGYDKMQDISKFLQRDKFIVREISEKHGLGLSAIYEDYITGFFSPEYFVIHYPISTYNEKLPYAHLSKLEYAAIHIFQSSHWDMSDEYRRNVITAAKKLLEECND